MILSIVSDLHLEFRNYDLQWLSSLKTPDADVAIFAGDIHPWDDSNRLRETVSVLSDMAKTVIWVPGNHEYYGTSPDSATFRARYAEEYHGNSNVRIITSPTIVHVDQQRFFCGTLWYSKASISKIADHQTGKGTRADGSRYIFSDYRWTPDLAPWVYKQNDACRRMLRSYVRSGDVVVTHHLPSPRSTPEQFKGEPDNAFFVSDCTRIINREQPRLWIHGHTHTPCEYTMGKTQVIANPCGYPHEAGSVDKYKPRVIYLAPR